MCAHSLLNLIRKLLIAELHFRSSIEQYLILVNINRLKKVDRHKLLVACIDDSISACKNLELFLTQQGYRSYGVQDPLKIMATLIKHKPDLIFLDLLMPMANGYEICQHPRNVGFHSSTQPTASELRTPNPLRTNDRNIRLTQISIRNSLQSSWC